MHTQELRRLQQLTPGMVVSERYEVKRRLGSGRMGSVYLAYDRRMEHDCALKLLHPSLAARRNVRERFLREVRLMNEVNHPNVVRTFDVGEDEGLIYFTMEFLEGRTLDRVLHQAGRLNISRALHFTQQLCLGLEAIHACSVIHRDLKPGNIMVLQDDIVKITDFGVARPKDSALTERGKILGTPQYMAPENIRGLSLTTAVDSYAVGMILYEMLVGRLPFMSEQQANVMLMQLEKEPTAPRLLRPEIPPWLNQLVMRLLQKVPQRRLAPRHVCTMIAKRTENRSIVDFPPALEAPPQPLVSGEAARRHLSRRRSHHRRRSSGHILVKAAAAAAWILVGAIAAFVLARF